MDVAGGSEMLLAYLPELWRRRLHSVKCYKWVFVLDHHGGTSVSRALLRDPSPPDACFALGTL